MVIYRCEAQLTRVGKKERKIEEKKGKEGGGIEM